MKAACRAADFPNPRNVIRFVEELPVPAMASLLLNLGGATDEDVGHFANELAQGAKS